MKNRWEGYEDCPGCVAVDKEGKPCFPYNAEICPIAWAKMSLKAAPLTRETIREFDPSWPVPEVIKDG